MMSATASATKPTTAGPISSNGRRPAKAEKQLSELTDEELSALVAAPGNLAGSENDPKGADAEERDAVEETRAIPWPAKMDDAAFHGLAGEFVRTILSYTEADPAALLTQFLAGVGNVVGRGPHLRVGASRHGANLFVINIGKSAKARKGTAWMEVRELLDHVAPDWSQERLHLGLSSGEGFICAVQDESDEDDEEAPKDKRLFVIEEEYSSVLKVSGREGNTLSGNVRAAWDGGTLQTMTKRNPMKATGSHISIVGHITRDELAGCLRSVDVFNGFANRFIWICVNRSKLLSRPGRPPSGIFNHLVTRLRSVIEAAKNVGAMEWEDTAGVLWDETYERLSKEQPGRLGAILARSEPQVLRLCIIYALLDGSRSIRTEHLMAALAVWEYAESSARFIWGDPGEAPRNEVAEKIFQALEAKSEGMTRSDISAVFHRNKTKEEIQDALDHLARTGLARYEIGEKSEAGGRCPERWWKV